MLAILEAKKVGLLQPKHWLNNIIAGIIVGVVALPLAMAFAIASGAKPEQGIYTAIIAGFFVSIFGGTRLQIAGPTGAFIVVLSGITAKYGIEGLQIASFMAGIILLFLGLAKMGSVIKFIPAPVIVGFTAGIGVIIWIGQWKDFFGLPTIEGEHFHNKLLHLLESLPQFHLATTLLALFALTLVIFSCKIPGMKRVPGPLVALIITTLIQVIFEFDGIKTIGSAFGGIPQGLPDFSLPSISLDKVVVLIGPAFTIAMLGAIESLLSAVVADGMAGTRHNSNQELVGQGLANIVAPLMGGFAATGAIARTATNIRNGGTSPLAGIIHSVTLVVILILLAPLADHIPLATLAAILFVVAWNMSEVKHFINMIKRAPRADVVILLITFTLTVFADLVVAVNIGVILATLHFLRRMATSVEVRQATKQELTTEFTHKGFIHIPDDLLVFTVEGPFFFGAVENFERALAGTNSDPKHLLIRLKWVPFIDITGLQTLEEVIRDLQKRQVNVMLSGANSRVNSKLKKAGIIELIGENNNFSTFDKALDFFKENLISPNNINCYQQVAITEPVQKMLDTSRDYFLSSSEQRSKGE
ncbi:SulP family inorganic anion transporter [Shewanella putrefaciens]|uniref:SulP family inorganic anion transporter n=1 Tax=Shewanella putrefaciens TaxID=24 RepID=UPI003D79F5A1